MSPKFLTDLFKSSLNLDCKSHVGRSRRLYHFVDGGSIEIFQTRVLHICAISVQISAKSYRAYIARRCLRIKRNTSSERTFLLCRLAIKVHFIGATKCCTSSICPSVCPMPAAVRRRTTVLSIKRTYRTPASAWFHDSRVNDYHAQIRTEPAESK